MSNYADEANTEDEATAVEDEFAPAGVPTPGPDVNEVNPETGPEGDLPEEGMETPIAPSGG
jgi:hypothetical protein